MKLVRWQATAALLLVATAARAQQAAPPEEAGPFFGTVDVNVVNVEVFVTDRKGNPVHRLTVDDFELFEDGRQVAISNFYAVEDGRSTTEPEAPAAPADTPVAALPRRPGERPPVPEDQRLHLIIYFDNLYLKPFSRRRVIREVRGFLASNIGPDDRVMVVTFERSLHLRQTFTNDMPAVYEALAKVETLTGFAVQNESERDQVLKNIGTSKTFEEAEPVVSAYARAAFHDLNVAIDGLKELVAPMAGLPGRKALLYVSDGIPMIAGAELFQLLDMRFGQSTAGTLRSLRYSARNRFRELVASANANRVTFYTLEARGLRSHASLSAASNTGATSGGSLIEIDVARDLNLQEPLNLMAHDTGGLATFSTNNIAGALERMGKDLSSYYSLGYVPGHLGDGRAYTIKVRVKQKGLTARHRTSYRDKTFETRLTESVLAILNYGGGSNPLDVRLEFSRARRHDGDFLVPLKVTVPFSRVALVPQGEYYQGRLRLVMAISDDGGRSAIPETTPLPLSVPAAAIDEARKQDVIYTVELVMRSGLHHIAVGLRDEMTGETAIVREAVRVGGP